MSTVLLTPTHIASDHNVVSLRYPSMLKTDLDHRKIFVHPDKTMCIGTCGDFEPESIDTPVGWHFIQDLYAQIITDLLTGKFEQDTVNIKDKEFVSIYKLIFDPGGRLLIVSKDYRFVVKYDNLFECLKVITAGDYCGIGSGGMVAAGIAMREKDMGKIFSILNTVDSLSSKDHTSFPLKLLKTHKKLSKFLKDKQKTKNSLLEMVS